MRTILLHNISIRGESLQLCHAMVPAESCHFLLFRFGINNHKPNKVCNYSDQAKIAHISMLNINLRFQKSQKAAQEVNHAPYLII